MDIPAHLLFESLCFLYVALRILGGGGIHGPGFRIQGLISGFASGV